MSSFHKPKVYRSPTGCCICKAKSSSSRFTDSKKYEEDFFKCFDLAERRTGEICNACVLLVKRFKKMSNPTRHWNHVVDARAGPGMKSLAKFRARNMKKQRETVEKLDKIVRKKHVYRPKFDDNHGVNEDATAGTSSKESSRSPSPLDCFEERTKRKRQRTEPRQIKQEKVTIFSDFVDLEYFKRIKICCGIIFKGPYGEVVIDPSLMKPCLGCITKRQAAQEQHPHRSSSSQFSGSASASPIHSSASASPTHTDDSGTSGTELTIVKAIGDYAEDSGYDDSNPGNGETKNSKTSDIDSTLKKHVAVKSATVTLEAAMVVGKQPEIKLTLSSSTSHPDVKATAANSLIDFAIHAAARQPIPN